MTPKEKAKEIYCNYTDTLNIRDLQTTANPFAKKCALIAVDEIITNNSKIPGLLTQDTMRNTWYWQEVKQEIEKL
jgi:hypothetical protein